MKKVLKEWVIKILAWEAFFLLKRKKPIVVAVTGSVGKTSAKDAIALVLSSRFTVRKSNKSYNSEFGIPLTVLGLESAWGSSLGWASNLLRGLWRALFARKYPECLVLETGVDRPGDMRKLVGRIKTDAVVFTTFPDVPVHVENFTSPEEVIKEKSLLMHTLKREGVLVLNYDDRRVMELQARSESNVITYGLDIGADILATHRHIIYEEDAPVGFTFKADYKGRSLPIKITGSLGDSQAYAVLAGMATGISLGLNPIEVIKAGEKYINPPGRMRIIEGLKNTIVIDDTYNSSPIACVHALNTLKGLRSSGRKIAILGDMAELGRYSEDEHKSIGKYAGEVADILITVGVKARDIAQGALYNGMDESNVFQFDRADKAGKHAELLLEFGDTVLVKGSQAVRMERAVEEIMAYPEQAKKLLVRQEEEWLARE